MCKRVERICQVDPEGWYAPVVGAELVRCKDCQHWVKNPYGGTAGLCNKHMLGTLIASFETDWCSWAEKKETE